MWEPWPYYEEKGEVALKWMCLSKPQVITLHLLHPKPRTNMLLAKHEPDTIFLMVTTSAQEIYVTNSKGLF